MHSKTIKIVQACPWFDNDYKNRRKQCRKAEKKFRKTGLPHDREAYVNLRKETTELAYSKNREFYTEKLSKANSSKTYSVVNKLLDVVLPSTKNDKELADSFAKYFSDKITKIRTKFTDVQSIGNLNVPGDEVTCLSEFKKTTEDEILQIVMSYGIKCSPEDPVPVNLLKSEI